MQLISELIIPNETCESVIQLLHGDLSELPAEHKTDILVLSAFPGDYSPTPGTLINALDEKGLSIEKLALDKKADLRDQLNCWLSKSIDKDLQQKLNIKRILCFEPGQQIHASQEIVGNIFRCINTFAFDEKNNVVAIPMVASGCQRAKAEAMLPALLEAAIFWLENGLPLTCIKLVIYRQEKVNMAAEIFNRIKAEYLVEGQMKSVSNDQPLRVPTAPSISDLPGARPGERTFETGEGFSGAEGYDETSTGTGGGVESTTHPPAPARATAPSLKSTTEAEAPVITDGYDYFISYAHTHSDLVHSFVQQVKEKNTGLQIFYDRESIPPGGLWIRQLSTAIQKAKKVLVFLSPDYDKSPVCWDEFQCAKLMEYNKRRQIIQTIYLYDYKEIEMPPIMGIYSYIDCREGDPEKLKCSIEKILNQTA